MQQEALSGLANPARHAPSSFLLRYYHYGMPLSADLVNKSVQAAIAAIEIYNKPNFFYREEAFSLLMTNAFELLFKAK